MRSRLRKVDESSSLTLMAKRQKEYCGVHTPRGKNLLKARFQQNQATSKVIINLLKAKKVLKAAIKMSIKRAHAILGHYSKEDTTQKTAAALNMQITRGELKTCEPSTVAKARQRNIISKSKGSKSETFNGQVYHNIAIAKESNDDKKLGRKTVWHVSVKETVNFKTSKFFVSKSEMPKYMCEYMESEMV
jgi:hypothetical protein